MIKALDFIRVAEILGRQFLVDNEIEARISATGKSYHASVVSVCRYKCLTVMSYLESVKVSYIDLNNPSEDVSYKLSIEDIRTLIFESELYA